MSLTKNFWQSLPKPFMVLAPMEGVTDVVFREVMTELPPPDVFFTEFTNADGLCSAGREATLPRLRFTENQRPIVAQIWGIHPENMHKAAQLVEQLGFDGVDINMGCPDRSVMKSGAGAALIKTPQLAKELIHAVKSGVKKIPVSVKTRIGHNSVKTDEWIPFLLEQNIAALTVHGRTAKQLSQVPADWNEIEKAVIYRDKIAPQTILIGNGDVQNYIHAHELAKRYSVDGAMIGRGIFANPWAFEPTTNPQQHERSEYLAILLRHLQLFEDTWGENKPFDVLKKFFKMYVKNFDGANQLRQELMECKSPAEVRALLSKVN